jgi:nucleotide-binding universal stress UspA family protein
MSKIVVGLDGGATGERAVAHAAELANLIGECELILAYVIEWSPYSFQTPEENEQRHKRREEEISLAKSRIVDPAVKAATNKGLSARGVVRHGDVADSLERIAKEEGANQIVVARSSDSGIKSRIFGSATANLVMHASVPVTVVN